MNTETQLYRSRFQDMREEKEFEMRTRAQVLAEHCEGAYDSVDYAEVLQRQDHATHEIVRYQNDIARITEVLVLLGIGWNGMCTKCGEVSVQPRLAIGVPTIRCMACQHEEEVEKARTHAFPRGGMLHMSVARGR